MNHGILIIYNVKCIVTSTHTNRLVWTKHLRSFLYERAGRCSFVGVVMLAWSLMRYCCPVWEDPRDDLYSRDRIICAGPIRRTNAF